MINRNWLQVKRAIFKSAREVYVLADSSKFGVGYVSVICPANLLKDLLKKFGGGACVSVYDAFGDYCREASYDYYDLPKWARSRAGLQEFLSDDNPNHYRSTCITLEEWWPDVEDRKVESWGIEINGHGDPGIWIHLVEEEKNEK